ncbi:hypothetical protein Hanom_Chr04g00368491 [Helianthus anomalus]
MTNINQNNKWLITSLWGDMIEVQMSSRVFKYLQDVDTYNGPKGALFIETTFRLWIRNYYAILYWMTFPFF